METVTDFIFLGSKITVDGDCSLETQKCLLLGRKAMTNLAADKSLQLCPTLCDPIDSSPPGSSIPGILQARTLEWVAISFSKACMHAKLLQSRPTLCNPMDSTPPDSSVRGILPARILDWVAISFSNDKLRQHIKKQRHYFANKGPSSQSYGFSSSHVGMWELDSKENWVLKNWCFWTVMLEKNLESPLDFKEIQPVHPKGNQSFHWKDWCWSWSSNTLVTW